MTEEYAVSFISVTENQFEITNKGIKHVPTGRVWACHPGRPFSGLCEEGYRGSKLPDERDFDVGELDGMMQRLSAEHV